MNISITIAGPDEYTLVIQLLKALYQELGEESSSVSFLSEDLIATLTSKSQTSVYLMRSGPEVIGIITITESQAIYAGGKYGVIDEMYVIPSHRGREAGKQMIDFVSKKAIEHGWKRVDVTAPTEARWERTRRFYEENGFVFTGPKYKLER